MWENALFCVPVNVVISRNLLPPPHSFRFSIVHTSLCRANCVLLELVTQTAFGTNNEGPCLTLMVMFLKVAMWSETL
jgi:hypothetical protein